MDSKVKSFSLEGLLMSNELGLYEESFSRFLMPTNNHRIPRAKPLTKSHGFIASMRALVPKKPPWFMPGLLRELVGERGYSVASAPFLYGAQGKAKRWSTAKRAISMQISRDGIPTLRSGYAIFAVGLTTLKVAEVKILIMKFCQKERKMTSLIAQTLRNGR